MGIYCGGRRLGSTYYANLLDQFFLFIEAKVIHLCRFPLEVNCLHENGVRCTKIIILGMNVGRLFVSKIFEVKDFLVSKSV